MSQWQALAKIHSEANKSDGREHPRFVASAFNCEKGKVTDFSATGLRIVYRKCPKFLKGQIVDLELFSEKGQHNCSATVMWVSQRSRKHTEIGFQFLDPRMAKKMRIFEFGFDALSRGILE